MPLCPDGAAPRSREAKNGELPGSNEDSDCEGEGEDTFPTDTFAAGGGDGGGDDDGDDGSNGGGGGWDDDGYDDDGEGDDVDLGDFDGSAMRVQSRDSASRAPMRRAGVQARSVWAWAWAVAVFRI